MSKIFECNLAPGSGCRYVTRGRTEQDALKNALTHAKEHGFHEPTQELVGVLLDSIVDEEPAKQDASA